PTFFLIAPPPTTTYTLSLHDALPIFVIAPKARASDADFRKAGLFAHVGERAVAVVAIQLRPAHGVGQEQVRIAVIIVVAPGGAQDRKSTRLNSSHVKISYAVFCLKKK